MKFAFQEPKVALPKDVPRYLGSLPRYDPREKIEYQHTNNKIMPSSTASPPTSKPAPADAKLDHSTLSAPSSLADLDPDLLRQILGFAQPTEHHHRFEWSGLVGRTCRVFRSISREDSDINGGVAVDLNKFHSYCSVAKARSHSRDLSVNFLSVLLEKDEVARLESRSFISTPVILESWGGEAATKITNSTQKD